MRWTVTMMRMKIDLIGFGQKVRKRQWTAAGWAAALFYLYGHQEESVGKENRCPV